MFTIHGCYRYLWDDWKCDHSLQSIKTSRKYRFNLLGVVYDLCMCPCLGRAGPTEAAELFQNLSGYKLVELCYNDSFVDEEPSLYCFSNYLRKQWSLEFAYNEAVRRRRCCWCGTYPKLLEYGTSFKESNPSFVKEGGGKWWFCRERCSRSFFDRSYKVQVLSSVNQKLERKCLQKSKKALTLVRKYRAQPNQETLAALQSHQEELERLLTSLNSCRILCLTSLKGLSLQKLATRLLTLEESF